MTPARGDPAGQGTVDPGPETAAHSKYKYIYYFKGCRGHREAR